MDFLTAPSTVLSLALATALAALFHLWRAKQPREMLLYWPASVIGFLVGQFAASQLGFHFATLGEVHPVEGTFVALIALVLASWLKL